MVWYLSWAGEWKLSSAAAQERFHNDWAIDTLSHLSRRTRPHNLRTGSQSHRGSSRRERGKKKQSSEAWRFRRSFLTVVGGGDSQKVHSWLGGSLIPNCSHQINQVRKTQLWKFWHFSWKQSRLVCLRISANIDAFPATMSPRCLLRLLTGSHKTDKYSCGLKSSSYLLFE